MGGAVLINAATGKPEWVDGARVNEAIKRGSHYSKSGKVNIKSDVTEATYNTPVENINATNFTPESVGVEIKRKYDAEERAKFDNPYDKFVSAAEGFASSATFGLADPLMDDYSTRKRAEVNSGWRSFGEIAGIVLPAIATGGGSVEAKAAVEGGKAAAGSLIGNAVKGAIKFTPGYWGAKLATRAGEKAASKFLVGGAASKITGAAVEAAVEGAMWNTGQQLSEAIIEDKEYSAQSLLSDIGSGALFGGAIGGAFAAAGSAIKKFKGKKVAHPLFDLDSEMSHKFRGYMAGMADDAIQYGDGFARGADGIAEKNLNGFQSRLDALGKLAEHAGGKDSEYYRIYKQGEEALGRYEKAKAGYRKILGLKPGHSVEEAEKALYRLMKQGGKNDIIAFAKKLDELHVVTSEVDDLLRAPAGLVDNLIKPTNLEGGYKLGVDWDNLTAWGQDQAQAAANKVDNIASPQSAQKTGNMKGGLANIKTGVIKPEAPEAGKYSTKKINRKVDETIVDDSAAVNAAIHKGGGIVEQQSYVGGRAGGMKRPPLEGTLPPIGGDLPPLPFIEDYANQANQIKNDLVRRANNEAAGHANGFSPKRFSDDVNDLASQLKDEYGAKFAAMDSLAIADALGVDTSKIPVLGPVADSFLKLWVFYRLGSRVRGVQTKESNGLIANIAGHAVGRKAGQVAGKKFGVMGGAVGYQAARAGVGAAFKGIHGIGVSTGKMTERIQGAVRSVLTPKVRQTIKRSVVPAYIQLSNVAYSPPIDSDPKNDYGRIAAQLERSTTDETVLQNHLNQQFEDFRILDPGLADEMVKATSAQLKYIHSKLPKKPVTWPIGMTWSPDPSEMLDFRRAATIFENPEYVFAKIENGTLQQGDMDDLSNIWPSLHEKALDEALKKVEEFEQLNNAQKKTLSIIIGTPMVSSEDPWMISYTQEQYNKERNSQEAESATIAGANGIKGGTATPGQQYGMPAGMSH